MPDEVDEYGIPIKKSQQQFDEFGIPVKKKEIGGIGLLAGGLYGTGGDGRSVSSGLMGRIKKIKPTQKPDIASIEAYNQNFREVTGTRGQEFSLGSDLPQIKKAREEKDYLKFRGIEENELKPVINAVRSGTASPQQLQTLYSKPYGRKIVSDVITAELPELAGIGGLDPEIVRSGEKWKEISQRLQEKNRPAALEAQNQSEFALDNELDNTFRNFTYGKEELVEGARKGDPRQLKETKIPFGAVNTTSAAELQSALDRMGGMPYVWDAQGNRKSTKDLREKIQERIFQLKAAEDIHPEIVGNRQMILDAVSKVPVEWKRKGGENPDLTNRDADYIMSGLNYIRDTDPGEYAMIMGTMEATGKISETQFTELAQLGRNVQYFKDFKTGKYIEQDDRSLITPQIKQSQLAGWLSQRLAQAGKSKKAAVPQSDILEAYQDAPEELKDEELLRNIINKERAPAFGFLPIAKGEGITKTGGLPSFMRGLASPFKSVVNSAEVTVSSPFESYLKSKELDRGNQLIPQKGGGYGDVLPSEKFWNKASEGFGSFMSQLFLARGFGDIAKIPANQMIGRVAPMARMTSREAALKLGTPLSTLAQTYGDEYIDFLEKTGSPTKAGLGAFVSGLTQGIIERNVMPDVVIAEKAALLTQKNNLAKNIIKVIDNGGGKAGVLDAVQKFVANTTKVIGKEAWVEENLQNLTNYLTEAIISPKTVNDRNLIKETVETGKAATVMMAIPSLLGGAGETKIKRSMTKAQLNAIAADPQSYIDAIDKEFSLGQISKEEHELATKIINLQRDNILNAPKRDANNEHISAERQLEYAYQSTVQQIAQEQAGKIKDQIQREPLEKKAEEADKIKRQIFYGEESKELPTKEGEPITIDQDRDLMDEEPQLTSAEMKAVKIAATEPLPGMYQEMLDSNPTEVIKEIAEQAQGITKDGTPLEGGNRTKDLLQAGVSQKFIDAAVEAYPAPKQPSPVSEQVGKDSSVSESKETVSEPTTPTIEGEGAKYKTKKEIDALPESDRESAIDALIYGIKISSKDAFDRKTGLPVKQGVYNLKEFLEKNQVTGNPIAKDILNKISKHPYFSLVKLVVTDNMGEGVKGENFVTQNLMRVGSNVDAETLSHEMMHTLTARIFELPYSSLTESEKRLRDGVNNIIREFDPNYKYLDAALGKFGYKRSDYAQELIAEAFIGSRFSKELNDKKVTRIVTRNIDKGLIQKIIDKIIEFFGGTVIKTETVQEKKSVVDALKEIFIKHGNISSERLKVINKQTPGEILSANYSKEVDVKSAIKRMKDAGYSDAEIKSEFEKRGIKYPKEVAAKESGISVQMPGEVTKPQTTEIKPAKAAPQEQQEQQQAEPAQADVPPQVVQKNKSIADKIRSAKIDTKDITFEGTLGLPVATWNTAVEIVAKAVEAGVAAADAIKRGLNYIQKNHRGQWNKKQFNDTIVKELGLRGIRLNGEDVMVKPIQDKQTAEVINGWYSPLEQSILNTKAEKLTGKEWASKLGGGEEMKWTGLQDFLTENANKPLTKKEVQQFLKDNRVEIVEVVLGKDDYRNLPEYKEADQKALEAASAKMQAQQKWWDTKKDEDFDEVQRLDKELEKWTKVKQRIEQRKEKEGVTKFSQYQLEGGKENYKEVLVTLPNKRKLGKFSIQKIGDGWYIFDGAEQLKTKYTTEQRAKDYIEFAKKGEKDVTAGASEFMSSHFDEPNILVHLRMNTRRDAEGKKVLFLEEIQSDWGQKGKKEGFTDVEQKKYDAAKEFYNTIWKPFNRKELTKEEAEKKFDELSKRTGVSKDDIQDTGAKYGDFTSIPTQGIPSAPFVTDTNSWVKLGLKTALKEAVAQGVDRVAWTTGEQQNERYDLSKQVDEITYDGNEMGGTLIGYKDGALVIDEKNVSEEKLQDYVGKEVAKNIIEDKYYKKNKRAVVKGEQLSVGGKGMKGFYDKIVPEQAKALVKELTGKEGVVEKTKIITGEERNNVSVFQSYINPNEWIVQWVENDGMSGQKGGFKSKENADKFADELNGGRESATQQSIQITPELKASVKAGMPLFKDRFKAVADALRKGKIDRDINMSGIPFLKQVWNGAIELAAVTVEKTGDLAKAIQEGIRYIKQSNWYKGLTADQQKRATAKFEEEFNKMVSEESEQADVPPVEPPTGEPPVAEAAATEPEGGGKKKSTLSRLYAAKNMPERAKEAFEKEGFEYVPASQEEAAAIAAATIDELGIDEAVREAAAGRFNGGVNAMIFGEALNRLADNENDAGQWADIAIQWDKYNRVRGQDISAINFFYKHSPLGVILKENAERKNQFNEWAKGKDQSWKEYFDELKSNPEFADLLNKTVQEDLKKERKSARATRIEKVRGVFAKAKAKFKKEGGGTYGTIIPPHVIETVLEAMELAYEAGEAIVKIVDDAIKSISNKTGSDNWDKEKFRKEWEAILSEKGGKAVLTEKELQEKVINKFKKKIKGLTDDQKDEVIRKSYLKLIQNNALDYDEFKEIIARVTGRGEMTDEQKEKLKEMVAKTNAAGEAAKVAQTERTPEALQRFYAAEIEAGRAARDLRDIFRQKPDILRRLTSIMQLSTLGAVSLVANVTYNIWNQTALRYPIGLINDTFDRVWGGIARMMGKPSTQDYNVWSTQGEFWNKMGQGLKESFEQIGTGLNRQDYTQKELYGQQMRPFKALRELYAYAKGKRPLTRAEWWDKLIEGTAGIPAELVARFLNVGDKPMRFAAAGAQAKAFTKALGLKDIDERLFIEFPQEEAYRYYKGQGLSDEAAQQRADYVAQAIKKEGERSTLQQDNLLSDAITRAAAVLPGGKDSGAAALTKTLVISPYIKIPTNVFWSYYNLVNPEIGILQSLIYAAAAKRAKNKGDTTKAQLLNREARYWMAHAILGMGLRAVVIAMVQAGRVTPPPDEEESKKERDAIFYFDKPGTIQVGDTKIQSKWFGHLGMLANSIARKYYDATPEQRENQDEFWNIVFGGMEEDALKELENGVFANTSSLFQSLSTGDWSRYGINTLNLFANIIQPATIAQINRAALDEVPTSKGDSFLDRLNQNFAQRSTLYRRLFDVELYKKQDIFGRPIPKGGNLLSRMFGISKANPQLEMRPLYDDFLRTGDSGFLPPAVPSKIGETKLTMQQQQKLNEYVGEERLRKLRPYVSGAASFPISNKTYAELTDEQKRERVQYLYEIGRQNGLEKFYKDYPEFKKQELSPTEKVEEKLLNVEKKLIKQ